MSIINALLAFGLPILIFLGLGYALYKFLQLVTPSRYNPVKVSRFEAGNIPTGEGRLWFPLQYYGYVLVYMSLEPIIVILLIAAQAPYYASNVLFRNLALIIGSFLLFLYPVIYFGIRESDKIELWELRR
ncbi:MAG: NADH-quinone oxidoreductase subunit A [Sulfolobaceae archaeon]